MYAHIYVRCVSEWINVRRGVLCLYTMYVYMFTNAHIYIKESYLCMCEWINVRRGVLCLYTMYVYMFTNAHTYIYINHNYVYIYIRI